MFGIAQTPEYMRKLTVSVTLNLTFVRFIAATAGFYEMIEVLEILKENSAKGTSSGLHGSCCMRGTS